MTETKRCSGKKDSGRILVLPKVILLVETSRAFGRDLLHGIARYSKLHGPWAFYREPRNLKSHIPHLKNWNANGIIMRNSVFSKELFGLKIPTIMVLHHPKSLGDLPTVATDGKSISKLAAEHLLSKGLRNFAFCGFDEFYWSNERLFFFRKYIEDAGFNLTSYDEQIKRKFKTWEKEQLQMADWIKILLKPVGILACNDDRGNHVLEACKIAKLSVPDEVSVIGVDNDTLLCDLTDPPLTSVALNTESAGFYTAELLDKLMHSQPVSNKQIVVSATHVVCRQSTDILAIDDQEVSDAMRFIRQNAKVKIPIDEIVNKTSLSRRSLELRFRKLLHHSILDEIRKVRADLIAKMLIETDLPISEITAAFDFTDQEHISRYFKKEKFVGLRQFRKQFK
jgi:LacI family transcriptional regulator